jgi:S1-C subfamily serine protease
MRIVLLIFAFVAVFLILESPQEELVYKNDEVILSAPLSETATDKLTPNATSATEEIRAEPLPLEEKTSEPDRSEVAPAPTIEATDTTLLRRNDWYDSPPLAFEAVDAAARKALVNILCSSRTQGNSISGSGIIVSDAGLILTNAHIAEYVLLQDSGKSDFSCVARVGSPATYAWRIETTYLPSSWVESHAAEIRDYVQRGTGEHDFALVRITSAWEGGAAKKPFPFVTPDPREGVGFPGDTTINVSYASELVSGSARRGLHPLSAYAPISSLLTFASSTADLLQFKGVVSAQSGSSGGGVINAWGRLIGVIVTTSEGATTGERIMHAITTAHIDRSLISLTGIGLTETLARNPEDLTKEFKEKDLERLSSLLLEGLSVR